MPIFKKGPATQRASLFVSQTMKKIPMLLAVIAALGLTVPTFTVEAAKIKKCKDAEGKWHYGDQAADECERANIIELSTQGITTKVIRPPRHGRGTSGPRTRKSRDGRGEETCG